MIRYEEKLRNLKIDVKRIPEWEMNIRNIKSNCTPFSIQELGDALHLINRTIWSIHNLDLDFERKVDDSYRGSKLTEWINRLNDEKLKTMLVGYNNLFPSFIEKGEHKQIIEIIQTREETETFIIKESSKHGVTENGWVEFFTSKLYLKDVEKSRRNLSVLRILKLNPEIEKSINLIEKIRFDSKKFGMEFTKIIELLKEARRKKEALDRFEYKHGKSLAKAAAVDGNTRTRATSLKRVIQKTDNCPYCKNSLGVDPHLDHIYPVSKGGLSITENLVWCCVECNLLKSDKGLVQFLNIRKLSIDETLSRLINMGKHI